MKRLKTFRLFESSKSEEDIISLYNDIESIGYILEEDETDLFMDMDEVEIQLRVKHPIRNEYLSIKVGNEEDVKRVLDKNGREKVEEIRIQIYKDSDDSDDNFNLIWTESSILKFDRTVMRYFNLLKDHLDYINSDSITFESGIVGNGVRYALIKIKI